MNVKDKVIYLIEKGFSYGLLGKICECHPSSLSKWIGGGTISQRMEQSIENHLQNFIKDLQKFL